MIPHRHRLAKICMLGLLAGPAVADEVPPDGRLVGVQDMRLNLVCTGQGTPSVVLEAGLGANHLDWSLVQPILARHVRVCSYDRAGAGFSSRTARPRSAANIVEELHDLARAGGIAAPFVLAGHSFGGMLARFYARRYPADVAGLVLLDPMHPDQFDRFAAAGVQLDTDPHMVLGRTPAFAATYGLPAALHPLAMQLAGDDKARATVVREMTLMLDDAQVVKAAGVPHVPTLVLVHGNREWDRSYPDGRMETVWTALQREQAQALGAPPPIVVAQSGHQMALDAPTVVADAVLRLADK